MNDAENNGDKQPLPEQAKQLARSTQSNNMPRHLIPEMFVRIWDWAWGFFELQSVGRDIKDHAPLVNKRVSVLILLGIIFIFGYGYKGWRDEDDIKQANYLSSSNAVIVATLDGQLQQERQNRISDKVDMNERLRERDAQIQTLEDDKNNALSRVNQLETMPQIAFLAYSNASAFMEAYTNANRFSDYLPQRMRLVPKMNGEPFTNWILGQSVIVPVNPTNRDIAIAFDHLSEFEKPIRDLTVTLFLQINYTNIVEGIVPGHWDIINHSDNEKTPLTVLQYKVQNMITPVVGSDITTLKISSNYSVPIFPAEIEVASPDLFGSFHYGFALLIDDDKLMQSVRDYITSRSRH